MKFVDSSAVRPMERGFENNLSRGIALRHVKASSGLVLAKDIGDTVIADAVPCTEVRVCVVIEGAPTDAAGVLRVGGELIVNPRVAQGMLALAFVVVGRLRRKSMTDKPRYSGTWDDSAASKENRSR